MMNIRRERGITLIALVITIIVMLILVAVTVSAAINGGLFNYAKTASERTEKQIEGEQVYTTVGQDLTVNEIIAKFANPKVTMYGDLNLDGKINAPDATLLAQYIAGNRSLSDQALLNADVDADGEVTPRDSMILARHLAGWEGYEALPYTQ